MSSGNFINSKYEDDQGNIYSIRVQPETISATVNTIPNAEPSAAVTQRISARATGSRRAYGLTARKITVKWDATGKPTDYDGDTVTIVILTPSVFNGISKNQAVSYLGGTGTVVSTTGEQAR